MKSRCCHSLITYLLAAGMKLSQFSRLHFPPYQGNRPNFLFYFNAIGLSLLVLVASSHGANLNENIECVLIPNTVDCSMCEEQWKQKEARQMRDAQFTLVFEDLSLFNFLILFWTQL